MIHIIKRNLLLYSVIKVYEKTKATNAGTPFFTFQNFTLIPYLLEFGEMEVQNNISYLI